MLQKELKKHLGGCGKIKIFNFLYYTIIFSYKYGSYCIEYLDDILDEIKIEAHYKAKELLIIKK